MNRRELLLSLGGVVVAAPALRAQQKAMPVIGYVSIGSPGQYASSVAAFREGLADTGYVEGTNVAIEYRWADGRVDRLPDLFAEIVARKVDVIVAGGGGKGALAAKHTTTEIPIVFNYGGDPVALGLVASFARPNRNMTGVAMQVGELMPKRLELLSELVPRVKVIALLVDPSGVGVDQTIRDMQQAARVIGKELLILNASNESEIDAAFTSFAQLHAGALLVGAYPFLNSRREQLVALASRHAVPAMYEWREFPDSGGLISYGPSQASVNRQIGIYVGKILNGAKPADLPVQQPTTFELVVNLKTARELGLTVPPSILARADEVIE